jgi:hypothetical protein
MKTAGTKNSEKERDGEGITTHTRISLSHSLVYIKRRGYNNSPSKIKKRATAAAVHRYANDRTIK